MMPGVSSRTQRPRALRPGAKIRLVSPASPAKPEKVEAMVALLKSEGYEPNLAKNAFASDHYLAGTDAERAADLQDAFDDPDVAAVLCTRGGYGCARLMQHLDLDRMAVSRKLFAGFSDLTTLHLALNQRGLPTLHAPMAISFTLDRDPWVYDSFKRALRGDPQPPATAPHGETLVGGVGKGEVTGGCLCLLTDSLATPNSLDCEGKIVLIEDVDEAPHRVDAMLTHLINANQIQRAAGIVVGEMTRTDEKSDETIGGRPWREIVRDRLEPLGIPTVVGYPFGHAPNMLSLWLGIEAKLDADAGTLTYLEEPCVG